MLLHRVIRKLAGWALWSFYREIHVIGEENVPREGPVIVVCTHHNMMVDPAVLSSTFPYKRPLHYWAKSSLFKNPIAKRILSDTGNIPVDRKSKDNQVLFRGTFEALAKGDVVALFPEGTSYTEPRIMQVKDGASWSALEFTKWARSNNTHRVPLVVLPTGIVYTNKSKYRSSVIVEFGKPIAMKSFAEEFIQDDPGKSRAAVKKLTARIEQDMIKLTINSPDWETLYAARMARDILWRDDKAINPDDFVAVSQTIIDLFCTPNPTPSFGALKRSLLTYYSLLRSTGLSNTTLSSLPLPSALNPSQNTPLPSRISTLFMLLFSSLASLIRLPFFLIPLIVHLPAYAMSRLGSRLVEDEEETQAQNKIIFAMLLLLATYPAVFFFLWALLFLTPLGAVLAFVISYAFVVYHVKIVDDNYEHAKRLVAVWRILLGVWAPKKWDLSLSALAPYTTPYIPPVSVWIDKPKVPTSTAKPETPDSPSTPVPPKSLAGGTTVSLPRRKRLISTRRLIRHVLRARSDATRLLIQFFEEVEKGGGRVQAAGWLADLYGYPGEGALKGSNQEDAHDGVSVDSQPSGWRDAREVVEFLRKRGAVLGKGKREEGEWAAASSEGEGEGEGEGGIGETTEDDLVWVPSGKTT